MIVKMAMRATPDGFATPPTNPNRPASHQNKTKQKTRMTFINYGVVAAVSLGKERFCRAQEGVRGK